MGKFLGGLAAASAAWAIVYWLVGPGTAGRDACWALCGEGTACVEGRCAIAAPEPEAPAVAEDEGDSKRRRGRRRRGGRRGADGPAGDGDAPFTPVNDSHVPQFSSAPVNLDKYEGSERLDDATVDREMNKLVPKFQRCVTAAAEASDEDLGRGTLRFKIRLGPEGKILGVSVTAPASLQVFGIVPCARKTVYDHRFPRYDGPPMQVDFSFDVD